MKATKDLINKSTSEALKEAEQKIINLEPTKNFVILYDTFYKNEDLTGDEIALFCYLITRSPKYKPNYKGLQYSLKISKERLTKASKGLQEKGYLTFETNGNKKAVWITTQTPIKPYQNGNYSREDILLFMSPQATEEKLMQGKITKEQAKEQLTRYISALKSKWFDDETDYNKHIQDIIKTKWID